MAANNVISVEDFLAAYDAACKRSPTGKVKVIVSTNSIVKNNKSKDVENIRYTVMLDGRKIGLVSANNLIMTNNFKKEDFDKQQSHSIVIRRSDAPNLFRLFDIIDEENRESFNYMMANGLILNEDYRKFKPIVATKTKKGEVLTDHIAYIQCRYDKNTKLPYFKAKTTIEKLDDDRQPVLDKNGNPLKQVIPIMMTNDNGKEVPYSSEYADKVFKAGNTFDLFISFFQLSCSSKGISHPLKPDTLIINMLGGLSDNYLDNYVNGMCNTQQTNNNIPATPTVVETKVESTPATPAVVETKIDPKFNGDF